jgi:hypothetical protein
MTNHVLSNRLRASRLDVDRLPWWRIAIILGVLFLSAYLARQPSLTYLAAIVGISAFLILLRLPQLGLISLVAGLFIPFSIGTGSQTPINTTFMLIPALLVIWLAEMIRQRKFQLAPSPTTLPLLALAASATLSLLAGSMPWNLFASTAPIAAQAGGWAVFAFSVGTFFLMANLVDDQRWLQIMTVFFLAIGGLYMAGRMGVPPLTALSALMTDMRSDGSIFWVWLMALAAGQLLFNRKLSPITRVLLALLIAATFYIGFFRARDWASGWFPPLVAVGTILCLRSWRATLLVAVVGVFLALLISPHSVIGLLQQETSAESYSLLTRDVARDILLEQVFPLSPIFGLGPANYYWYTPLYSILGWYVKFNSHNNYVDILMQTGIVGLVCFFWVVGTIALLGWRLRKRFAGDFAQGYVYAGLGGLAGSLVAAWLGDWLLPFVYNIGLNGFRASILAWLFLGGLVALDRLSVEKASAIGAPDLDSIPEMQDR